jgi:hypothetical protein
LRASTIAGETGEDVGYIRSESIGHDLKMVIEELIGVYDSVVEENWLMDNYHATWMANLKRPPQLSAAIHYNRFPLSSHAESLSTGFQP